MPDLKHVVTTTFYKGVGQVLTVASDPIGHTRRTLRRRVATAKAMPRRLVTTAYVGIYQLRHRGDSTEATLPSRPATPAAAGNAPSKKAPAKKAAAKKPSATAASKAPAKKAPAAKAVAKKAPAKKAPAKKAPAKKAPAKKAPATAPDAPEAPAQDPASS